MDISLPDSLYDLVLKQVAKHGYGSVSEYIGALVRGDLAQASLEDEILRGIESGESAPMKSDEWTALRSRVRESRRPA